MHARWNAVLVPLAPPPMITMSVVGVMAPAILARLPGLDQSATRLVEWGSARGPRRPTRRPDEDLKSITLRRRHHHGTDSTRPAQGRGRPRRRRRGAHDRRRTGRGADR